jgi:hypothetical protein
MIITLILVSVASLALGLLIRLAKGRGLPGRVLENPTEHMRAVDLEAFRNLVDPDEEEFLRTNLPSAEFRRIQRERLRAAVEYVSCAAQNAAVLLRLADAGRRSPDPATALYALKAIPKLYLGMALPGARISAVGIAERYEQMTRLVVLLGCLQYPTRGVSAAL